MVSVKQYIFQLSYPRRGVSDIYRGVWNGRNALSPCALDRRDVSATPSACTRPTSTSTTSPPPPPPSPTGAVGFHVLGLYTGGSPSSGGSIEVVGSAHAGSCAWVLANEAEHAALGVYVKGPNATVTGFMQSPVEINSSVSNFALLAKGPSQPSTAPFHQLCGKSDPVGYGLVFMNRGSGLFGEFPKQKLPFILFLSLLVAICYLCVSLDYSVCSRY